MSESIDCRCRESLVLYHGQRVPFLLSFPDELGDVGPVNLKWEYDRHITDLLNPVTACLPIFCSDGLFVDRVEFSADQHCNPTPGAGKEE